MATFDPTGLVVDRLADVREQLVQLAAAYLGADVQTGTDSRVGQLLDSYAVPLAELWGVVQRLADEFDPDQATGTYLDNLCALVGITREPASASQVLLKITGTPATVVPAGTRYRVLNGPIFATDAEETLDGFGSAAAQATATTTGPQSAAAGTITVIVDAVAGVTGVDNVNPATPGQNAEDDDSLRIRRESSLRVTGAASDAAIRSRLVELTGVQAAAVISNRTLVTDVYGIPGKAFRAIIWPAQTPEQQALVAEAIWETAPAGIYIDGTESAVVLDDQGYAQTIRWSVATELEVYVDADVTTDTSYPLDGDDQVKAAVASVADDLSLGDDLYLVRIVAAVAAVEGVIGAVITAKVGSPPSGGDTADIVADVDEIVTIDVANVTVS